MNDPALLVTLRQRRSSGSVRPVPRLTDGKLWLYDQQGTVTASAGLRSRPIRSERARHHTILCGQPHEVRGQRGRLQRQKMFVDELTAIARDHGDSHSPGPPHPQAVRREPQAQQVRLQGNRRNHGPGGQRHQRVAEQEKEKDAAAGKMVAEGDPDAMLICDKQRNGEWEGRLACGSTRTASSFWAIRAMSRCRCTCTRRTTNEMVHRWPHDRTAWPEFSPPSTLKQPAFARWGMR